MRRVWGEENKEWLIKLVQSSISGLIREDSCKNEANIAFQFDSNKICLCICVVWIIMPGVTCAKCFWTKKKAENQFEMLIKFLARRHYSRTKRTWIYITNKQNNIFQSVDKKKQQIYSNHNYLFNLIIISTI